MACDLGCWQKPQSVHLKRQQEPVLKLSAILFSGSGNVVWACTHMQNSREESILKRSSSRPLSSLPTFPPTSCAAAAAFCAIDPSQWLRSIMVSRHTHCPVSSWHLHTRTHTCGAVSSGMDLCVPGPPVGAEIVLFLSESPLIFYYAIKSICSTHKQLEIKWAPLKGLCACVCTCVCVSEDWLAAFTKRPERPFTSSQLLVFSPHYCLWFKLFIAFTVAQSVFTSWKSFSGSF